MNRPLVVALAWLALSACASVDANEILNAGAELAHCQAVGREHADAGNQSAIDAYDACKKDAGL